MSNVFPKSVRSTLKHKISLLPIASVSKLVNFKMLKICEILGPQFFKLQI